MAQLVADAEPLKPRALNMRGVNDAEIVAVTGAASRRRLRYFPASLRQQCRGSPRWRRDRPAGSEVLPP